MTPNDVRNSPDLSLGELVRGLGMPEPLVLFLIENPQFQTGAHLQVKPDLSSGHLSSLLSKDATLALVDWAERNKYTTAERARELRSAVAAAATASRFPVPSIN